MEAGGVEAAIQEAILSDHFPVSFQMAEDELTTTADEMRPRALMVHLSRQSYLPLVFEQIREHFADAIPPLAQAGQMWCSCEESGVPLRWHHPCGVLFDAHGSQQQLPWGVVVHFTKFPHQELLNLQRSSAREDVQWHFMNTMKESIFLQYGSTQPLTSLGMEQQAALWSALLAEDACKFADAAAPLSRGTNSDNNPR